MGKIKPGEDMKHLKELLKTRKLSHELALNFFYHGVVAFQVETTQLLKHWKELSWFELASWELFHLFAEYKAELLVC